MSDACQYLHETLSRLPRYKAGFDPAFIPRNGIYFLFETGEIGHGFDRVVRVGTHRGEDNLAKRIREHLFTKNKDRSIFRKHVGRCLLTKKNNPFLSQWEIDLTTKNSRQKYDGSVDMQYLSEIEDSVSDYMNANFSFVAIEVSSKEERIRLEESFISTIAKCTQCNPSVRWLGLFHPNPVIKRSGLWNVQGLNGATFERSEIERVFK